MRLGTALARTVAALGLSDRLARQEALTAWAAIVGPAVAAHAWPVRLHGHTLVVAADGHAWSAQLQYLRTDIVRRMRARGIDGVHQLQFVIGAAAERPPLPPEPDAPRPAAAQPRTPAENALQALDALRRAAPARQARLASGAPHR